MAIVVFKKESFKSYCYQKESCSRCPTAKERRDQPSPYPSNHWTAIAFEPNQSIFFTFRPANECYPRMKSGVQSRSHSSKRTSKESLR